MTTITRKQPKANPRQKSGKRLILPTMALLLVAQQSHSQPTNAPTAENETSQPTENPKSPAATPQTADIPEPAAENQTAPTSRWTGGYIGLQLGGAAGASLRYYAESGQNTRNFGVDGITGGVTLGYNQAFGKLIAGLDTNFSVNSISGTAHHPDKFYAYTTANPWLSTFRVKMGYDLGDFMPYLTSGLAVGRERVSAYVSSNHALGDDYSHTQVGWVLGAGIEKAVTDNLSIKAEYQYLQFNRVTGPSSNNRPTYASLNENLAVLGVNYKFDPALAPHAQPASLFSDAPAAPLPLSTETGVELGGQVSDYRYEEHASSQTDFMHEAGAKFGINALATQAFRNSLFVTGDFRFAYSSNNYSSPGSGAQQHIPDYLWDTRVLIGKDFIFNQFLSIPINFSLAPYIGIGYRNLYNDLRGNTDLGYHGYRRDSEYLYLPLGVTKRYLLSEHERLSANIEYDQLVEGWQTSYLSDASPQLSNAVNGQYGGYGLRGHLLYERANWSAGPFFNYWVINQSGSTRINTFSTGFEPHNDTLEYGLQARYRF